MSTITRLLQSLQMEKQAEARKLNLGALLRIGSNLKFLHVKTKRYSAHKALDDIHEKICEHMDRLLECIQGKYDDLSVSNYAPPFKNPIEEDDVLPACKDLLKQFNNIVKPYIDGDPALESAVNEIQLDFYQLFYLLRRKG